MEGNFSNFKSRDCCILRGSPPRVPRAPHKSTSIIFFFTETASSASIRPRRWANSPSRTSISWEIRPWSLDDRLLSGPATLSREINLSDLLTSRGKLRGQNRKCDVEFLQGASLDPASFPNIGRRLTDGCHRSEAVATIRPGPRSSTLLLYGR